MTAVTMSEDRILSLDVVRGVAVMGILAMNIVAFAMPFSAYMNPIAYGAEGPADLWSWALSFIFVDGKMRGLFSFLFGASALLVIERAAAAGASPASVHYRRMAWLLVFGLIHYYFIWFGDILSGYAMIGLLLFLFRNLGTRSLVRWGVILVTIQALIFAAMAAGIFYLKGAASAPGADPAMLAEWRAVEAQMGVMSGQGLADKLALFRGPWTGIVDERLTARALQPFTAIPMFGWETLAYMLFGMAALKSGFFTGAWEAARYRRIALWGLAFSLPVYALLAWLLARSGFSIPMIMAVSMAATTPFRPVMVVAYAALIILLARRSGWLIDRIAAAGRAAFTNYLGTSLLMTLLFYGYGFGLYGSLRRVETWLVVLPMWALMLLWSKPWLERFRYGPFEWLWRSLAQGRFQPIRRAPKPALS